MESVLGKQVDWEKLLNPTTDEDKEKVRRLKEEFKMDPAFMKKVDDKYGPFEWRLPDAHSIYWAMMGLEKCTGNKKYDLMSLRRQIYQPMLLNFHRGRLVENQFSQGFEYRPNLDAIANTTRLIWSLRMRTPSIGTHISEGHKNFLKDAIIFSIPINRIKRIGQVFQRVCPALPGKSPS
jgi:hypothetical protein